DAAEELVKIGKPSIPPILTAWVDLKMGEDHDIIRGNLLDQVLRRITHMGSKYHPQGGTPGDIQSRESARDNWFQWWGDGGVRGRAPTRAPSTRPRAARASTACAAAARPSRPRPRPRPATA